jgi:cytochrome c553
MRAGGWLTIALGASLVLATGSLGDEGRGKEIFSTVCSACHGPQGGGNQALLAPSIAGLDEWYIVLQLDKFRAGWRGFHSEDVGGQRMAAMARSLNSEDAVREVAAYVASLPPVKPTPTLTGGNPTQGANVYAACIACHGFAGDGNRVIDAPAINHASDWYLLEQLNNYRNGIRGSTPGDRNGPLMRAMARTLPNEQAMRDVIAYITTALTPVTAYTPPAQ